MHGLHLQHEPKPTTERLHLMKATHSIRAEGRYRWLKWNSDEGEEPPWVEAHLLLPLADGEERFACEDIENATGYDGDDLRKYVPATPATPTCIDCAQYEAYYPRTDRQPTIGRLPEQLWTQTPTP